MTKGNAMNAIKYCAICDRDHTTDPGLVLARWQDQDICTDCLEHRPGKKEAEAEARGDTPPQAVARPPVRQPRFVRCGNCDELYPRPQTSTCPNCQESYVQWHAWDPRDEDCPGIEVIADIMVGLLELLEESGHNALQDHDGRLYEAVKDALIVMSQHTEIFRPYEDFYLQPTTA